MPMPSKALKAIAALNEVAAQIAENEESVVGFVVALVYQADDQVVVDCRSGGSSESLDAVSTTVNLAASRAGAGEMEAEFDGELDDSDGDPCKCENCRPRAH
jgi:hypothetical protein